MDENDIYNEVVSHFTREENRKQSLESKASYLLGIIILIFTIFFEILINILLNKAMFTTYILLIAFLMIILIIKLSIVSYLSISILKVSNFCYPIGSVDSNILEKELCECEKEDIIDKYITCININNKINNKNAIKLKKSMTLIVICIVILLSIIVLLIGAMYV
ncbi:hypothetical protein [Methanobrevibacter sp. DSM 116169]|uniref:hypothetical protein n=1 Tax=Methanobrevibacter sp. DSM 116169 TaxID=3242727 RepID=UPI0038FC65FE